MSWVAYVDESIRTDDGVYVLAAATIDDDDVDAARDTVRALAPQAGQRFHWRDQKAAERRAAAAVVGQMASLHVVVIGARSSRGVRSAPADSAWRRCCSTSRTPGSRKCG